MQGCCQRCQMMDAISYFFNLPQWQCFIFHFSISPFIYSIYCENSSGCTFPVIENLSMENVLDFYKIYDFSEFPSTIGCFFCTCKVHTLYKKPHILRNGPKPSCMRCAFLDIVCAIRSILIYGFHQPNLLNFST